MIGVDSSVLIRHLTQDDERQAAAASALLEEDLRPDLQGYVSIGTLLETIWVLQRSYRYPNDLVREVVSKLLAARQLFVAERAAIERALTHPADGLADAVIHELNRQAGCTETVTFDRRFARLPGVRLLAD